jgi:stringent starvation protein B
MFLKRGFLALLLSLDSGEIPILRENNMVLNGAIEHEELALIPVDGFDAVYGQESGPMPVFIFGDDDDVDDEDDFEDDEGYENEEDDFEDEDELEEDDDDDEDDDFDDDDEEDDFEDEDEEDWDDDYE